MVFVMVLVTLRDDFYLLIRRGEGDRNHPNLLGKEVKRLVWGKGSTFLQLNMYQRFSASQD